MPYLTADRRSPSCSESGTMRRGGGYRDGHVEELSWPMTSWLAECSIEAVRVALANACPDLAALPIVLHDSWVETGNPLWARSSAFVENAWVVKLAWTELAAVKLEREIQTLRALATSDHPPPVRRVHASSSDPVLLVAPFVAGAPVTGEMIERYSPTQTQRLADELAEVLAAFHDPATRHAVIRAQVRLPIPTPQANTTELRERFCPMLDLRRRELVRSWCDWSDNVLAAPAEPVVLHGDFHGYNIIIDETQAVRVILDVEEASYGDYHYDFRYLPAQEATLSLFLGTVATYERFTGRHVALDRVMAWHVRTVLGDALWRTEATVELPEGGTPTKWVDELDERLNTLKVKVH
jgi:aminoglycoside phosphotransferase (APT) family kinase protein